MIETNAILKEMYPVISTALNLNEKKYKECLNRFVEARSKSLYDICPCDRIYFLDSDRNDFFTSINVPMKNINDMLKDTYYYNLPSFKQIAKDEFTIAMMCVVRYYFLKKDSQMLDLSLIYLSFSGKLYPSIHYGKFPKVAPSEYRHVMEYVVNNELSGKFDIKREKTVFGAIRSISNTWMNSYNSRFKTFSDEDVTYLIQQLHNRIKSFMGNIAEKYYEVYNNKEKYLSYDSDDMSQDSFRLADNDSLMAERCVEKTMTNISNVDYLSCKRASNSNVRVDEVKSIIESILENNENLSEVKELIQLIVNLYLVESESKNIRDIKFITFSITPKPNSKDKNYLRQKEIIEKWLEEGSPAYRKRKSREATKISYNKAILTYFTLVIYNYNK